MSFFLVLFDVFITLQHYTHDLFDLHITSRLLWLRFYARFFSPVLFSAFL